MITSLDFDKLIYKDPASALNDKRDPIDKIIGIDSEAYTTGVPFLFSTSIPEIISPDDLPDIFFEERYVEANFVIFNMKYDSGALLYHLERESLMELWEQGSVIHEDFRYKYIPHKQLRIYKGKEKVTFWDISQFFKHGGRRLTLDSASRIYLGESKLEMRTKNFTPLYVRKYWKAISRYAIQDAVLAQKLGVYFVNKLDQFGITPTAIYSCASISFKYFCDHANVVTSWKYWQDDQNVLKFACDAYEGGKFEVTSRGPFTGYEYDISSAYPFEIANLVDISRATTVRTAEYQPKAVYGFLRCFIDNTNAAHIPCGMMRGNVRIYPAGQFYLTITKQEYDYLLTLGIPVVIHDAIWLFVKRKSYPYRSVISTLYNLKSHYKGKDRMAYDLTKIVQNSFYGKTAQVIEMPDGKFNAGAGWNPVYASIITANPRIKITAVQNAMKDDCLAVHTDSVILTKPMPKSFEQDGKLGNFEPVVEGDGILIACGMYQIGEQNAFKGFKPRDRDSWRDILGRNYSRQKIKYRVRHVESWIESMAKNHAKSSINLFQIAPKVIDLNCDVKRNWPSVATAKSLLTTTEQSNHKIIVDTEKPKFWA
jgi:hypothetical protein